MWTPLRQAAPAPAHGLFMFVTIVMAPTQPDSWAAITKSGHSLPVTTNQFEAQLRQPLSEQTTPVAFHKRFFPRPNFALSIFLLSSFALPPLPAFSNSVFQHPASPTAEPARERLANHEGVPAFNLLNSSLELW